MSKKEQKNEKFSQNADISQDKVENSLEKTNFYEKNIDSRGKKTKKTKKPMSKAKALTIFCAVGIVFLSIGVAGGIFLAYTFAPTADLVQDNSKIDFESLEKRADKASSIEDEFRGDAYNLVNLACYRQINYKYTYTSSYSVVDAGVANQLIKTATFSTPDTVFNQAVATSSFVRTAYRFYNNKKETTAYEFKEEKDWINGKNPSKVYSNNEYIQTYGKLLSAYYPVKPKENFKANEINQTYVNEENIDKKDTTIKYIQGTIIYDLTKKSVNESSLSSFNDNLYKVDINLKIDQGNGAGITCYQKQMVKNGGLSKSPFFYESKLSIYINKNSLTLNKAEFFDHYYVQVVGRNESKSTLKAYYYQSNSSEFSGTSSGNEIKQNIKIPELGESFNGFNFFDPEKEYKL